MTFMYVAGIKTVPLEAIPRTFSGYLSEMVIALSNLFCHSSLIPIVGI